MHSIADVANYAYRLVELNRSAKDRDSAHPYGYAPLRYITADRSFVFLGFVGGVFPVLEGLSDLAGAHAKGHGVPLPESLLLPAAVFLVSAALEKAALSTAYKEILSQHQKEIATVSDAASPKMERNCEK